MRPTPDKMSAFMALLKKKMNFKSLVITLAAIVVFTTTYLLVLPAFTLDKEEAAEQGGIDVAVEQTVETVDEEAPAEQAEESAAEQNESADAVTEAEEPAAKEEVKEETASPAQKEVKEETASPAQKDSEVKEEKKEEKEEVKLLSKKKELTAEKEKTDDFTISAVVDKDAKVPEDVFLQATELTKDTEGFDYDKYYKDALKALKKDADNVKGIKTIKFYDISLEAESQDESVEPKAAVNVKIAYEDGLKVNDADNIRIVHFAEQKDGEVKAEVLDNKDNKVETTVNKKSEMTEASFDTEGFSVFAVAEMELVNEFTITNPDGEKVTYLVSATYGPKAEIPADAVLSVKEYGKLSGEYRKAYKAVIEQKLSEDDMFDESSYGMTAFDISILDAEGNKVEPKDTVRISLSIKDLPKEVIKKDASQTLEIQHLDESQNYLKVETVASVEDGNIKVKGESAEAEFKLDSFSTFTIGWNGRNGNNSTTSLRWRDANNVSRGYFTVQYIDDGENAIRRPDGIGATVDFNGFADGAEHTFNIESDLVRDVEHYTYKRAYVIKDGQKAEVTSVKGERHGNVTTITYYNGDEEVLTASYEGTGRHDFTEDGMGLTIEYANHDPHTTVHYGYMEDGVFHEFTQEPDPTHTDNAEWAYLLYDFEGKDKEGRSFDYNYANTYYQTNETTNPTTGGTEIIPALRSPSNDWLYYPISSGITGDALRTNGNWNSVENESHIYVVYKEPIISEGGTPTMDDDITPPDAPTILKQSVDNGDATNTLSLSITSSSKDLEVETLADVIIVLDLSSSMRNYITNNNAISDYQTNPNSRYYQAMRAVETLANNLYAENEDKGKDLFRLGLVTFAGNAQVRQELTEDKDEFLASLGAINAFDGKGTNWEHSIKLANEMATSENRATFVIFVTDGEPTTSQTRSGFDNYDLRNNHMFVPGNENGTVPNNYSHLNRSYNPLHYYLSTATFGTTDAGNATTVGTTSVATYDDIELVQEHNKNFYTIAISNEIVGKPTLEEIEKRVPDGHIMTATDSSQLEKAFEDLEKELTGLLGWGDVEMTDGITNLTSTVAKRSDLVNFDPKFTYYKTKKAPEGWSTWTKEQKDAYQTGIDYKEKTGNPPGYDSWSDELKTAYQAGKAAEFEVWTDEARASVNCADATYEGGTVHWNMGKQFMPEAGVTYKVSFKCWPSQDAYDTLAKCRNYGDEYYNSLPQNIKDQIQKDGDVYTLRTNEPDAHTTYTSATKTGNVVSTGEDSHTLPFGEVPNLNLSEEKINILKKWENKLDAAKEGSVNLGVAADGKESLDDLFARITLKNEEDWKGSAYISTGQLEWDEAKQKLFLLETGHDFTITENVPGGPGHRWELEAETYRPMVITDSRRGYVHETVILQKVDDEADAHYVLPATDGSGDSYYQIVPETSNELKATNHRRSNLNLIKHVVRQESDVTTGTYVDDKFQDEKFTYEVKVDDSSVEEATGQDVWFSVLDENGDTVFEPEVTEATAETQEVDSSSDDVSSFSYDQEKGTITYRYKDNAELTTYKVISVSGTKYNCKTGYFYVADTTVFTVKMKPAWNLRVLNLPTGSTYRFTEVDIKDGFECLGTVLTTKTGQQNPDVGTLIRGVMKDGTIGATNTEYTVAYFNKANLYDIKIVKTDNGTPPKNLGGATFELYKKNASDGYDPVGDAFVVPKDGFVVKDLSIGDYKLVEVTPPDGYNIKIKAIFFKITGDPNQVITLDGDYGTDASVAGDELHVQNPPGPELPMTGGIGTTIFYILGSILAVGCGIVLIARRRAGIGR